MFLQRRVQHSKMDKHSVPVVDWLSLGPLRKVREMKRHPYPVRKNQEQVGCMCYIEPLTGPGTSAKQAPYGRGTARIPVRGGRG